MLGGGNCVHSSMKKNIVFNVLRYFIYNHLYDTLFLAPELIYREITKYLSPFPKSGYGRWKCLSQRKRLYSQLPRTEGRPGHTGPHGATQERTRGSRAGHRRKPVFWFLQEQMGKAGRAGSGLASLNFSRGSREQGLPLAVSYPAPG